VFQWFSSKNCLIVFGFRVHPSHSHPPFAPPDSLGPFTLHVRDAQRSVVVQENKLAFRFLKSNSIFMSRKSVHIGLVAGAALDHFAALLRIKRREKKLTVAELADRLGISIPTARNLLCGNPAVAIGTYFEAATILGLALFEPDQDRFQTSRDRVGKIESLLPKRVVKPVEAFDDDF